MFKITWLNLVISFNFFNIFILYDIIVIFLETKTPVEMSLYFTRTDWWDTWLSLLCLGCHLRWGFYLIFQQFSTGGFILRAGFTGWGSQYWSVFHFTNHFGLISLLHINTLLILQLSIISKCISQLVVRCTNIRKIFSDAEELTGIDMSLLQYHGDDHISEKMNLLSHTINNMWCR